MTADKEPESIKRKLPTFGRMEAAYLRKIGRRIRDLRTERKYSQAGLAAKLGMSPNQIMLIETGRTAATVLTLRKIARELGVSIGRITDEVDSGD